MTSLINLPDDFFKQQLLQYLSVRDIAGLDTACTSHKWRADMLVKLTDVILVSDMYDYAAVRVAREAEDLPQTHALRDSFHEVRAHHRAPVP